MQGGSLCNTSTVLAHHKHCVVGAGAGAGDWSGRSALFLVELVTWSQKTMVDVVVAKIQN